MYVIISDNNVSYTCSQVPLYHPELAILFEVFMLPWAHKNFRHTLLLIGLSFASLASYWSVLALNINMTLRPTKSFVNFQLTTLWNRFYDFFKEPCLAILKGQCIKLSTFFPTLSLGSIFFKTVMECVPFSAAQTFHGLVSNGQSVVSSFFILFLNIFVVLKGFYILLLNLNNWSLSDMRAHCTQCSEDRLSEILLEIFFDHFLNLYHHIFSWPFWIKLCSKRAY